MEKGETELNPWQQIGTQCGAHGSKMPQASCITTHYIIGLRASSGPASTAPIPIIIQWLTVWPGPNWDTSHFHWEDCSNQSILGCWSPHDCVAAVESQVGYISGVLMFEEELQKRTLPIMEGYWGSTGTSQGKEADGVPLLFSKKELFGELIQEGLILRRRE